MIEGRYFWVPMQRIRSVSIEKPVDLRDVVWLPAHFTWTNGGESYGVILRAILNLIKPTIRYLRYRVKLLGKIAVTVCFWHWPKNLNDRILRLSLMDIRSIQLNSADEPPMERSGG